MKASIVSSAVVIALSAALCETQTAMSVGGSSPVGSSIGYGGGYAPYMYYHSSTAAEGVARGLANVIRAKGDYNLSTAEGAVSLETALQRGIENRKRLTQAYFDIRQINRQAREVDWQRQRAAAVEGARYAQVEKAKRLTSSELDPVTGEIHWPVALMRPEFAETRAAIEKVFIARAYQGVMTGDELLTANEAVDSMLAQLKLDVQNVPPAQYVSAKRFLASLVAETSVPPV